MSEQILNKRNVDLNAANDQIGGDDDFEEYYDNQLKDEISNNWDFESGKNLTGSNNEKTDIFKEKPNLKFIVGTLFIITILFFVFKNKIFKTKKR